MDECNTFKGRIGLPLEAIINQQGLSNISADVIECGGFVPVMALLLCNKYRRTPDIIAFLKECDSVWGLSYNDIPLDTANKLFDKFIKLFTAGSDMQTVEE
ncbi:MAG: hypothetical protein J6J83_07780 [Oscillospiraceae bacterium]|nr:hypothetical protein [Oscillospiraceae bacterium]